MPVADDDAPVVLLGPVMRQPHPPRGAVFGLALYYINVYTLTLLFPWFFMMQAGIFAVTHVIFGAVAGATYELLEVEEFVPVDG